jgi:hypothetical protein
MATANKTCDVFICHSARDAPLAREFALAFHGVGLESVAAFDVPAGSDESDLIWQAIAESRAILVILPPSGLTASMAVEIGAAGAWNKPFHVIVTEPATPIPAALKGAASYPSARIDDVIKAIGSAGEALSDDDRQCLIDLYRKVDVSVDELTLQPMTLREIVDGFRARTHKAVPGERLLTELLRMRKRGVLSRGSRPLRSKVED